MSILFMIAVYFVIWWLALFVVLPFGVRTQAEAGSVVPGTPESAPANFSLIKVALATTALAALIFAVLWGLVAFHVIDVEGLVSPPNL